MNTRGSAWRTTGVTILGALAFLAVPAGSAEAATASRGDDLHSSTRANVTNAMKGEAFAHAKYRAYADQAGNENLRDVRALFNRTGNDELREHFTEQAKLIGLVGGNAANLRATTKGESYEASTMYKKFAEQARADGDKAAADLFTEIGKDEAAHNQKFAQALKAVSAPSSGARIPIDVTAKPAAITAGPPQVKAERTLRNLRTAMEGEALANAKYTLYADRARETGKPRLAKLFHRTAQVERTEHFAEQARLAGLVRDTSANLKDAIAGETQEGTRMYPGYARQAASVGDTKAAKVFADTGRDELKHAHAFKTALSGLAGHGSAAR